MKNLKNFEKFFEKKKIDSEESFREWAEKVLKKAHKDNYSEKIANKMIEDLVAEVRLKKSTWGDVIGKVKKSL